MFKRNKNTAPQKTEMASDTLFPGVESEHLNKTVTVLDQLQRSFLDDCIQKNLGPAIAAQALRAAMQEGAYPAAVSTRPRRDNNRVVSIIHGTPPEGLVEVVETGGTLKLAIGKSADGNEWPTEPDLDDPSAFYVKSYEVVTADQVPFYPGDALRNQENAAAFKDLNTELTGLLSLPNQER